MHQSLTRGLGLALLASVATLSCGQAERVNPIGPAPATSSPPPPPQMPDPDPDPDPDPKVDPCEVLNLDAAALNTRGPYGALRGDLADDFELSLLDDEPFRLFERWSGCETYHFQTSGRSVSALDATSIWERDLDALIAESPRNAHYFFVATRAADQAQGELAAMRERVTTLLSGLSAQDADWWGQRLHVVSMHRDDIPGWVGELLGGIGAGGFAIGRDQQIHLLGSFADVTRFSAELNAAGEWPWENNLAYAGYEAQYLNALANQQSALQAEPNATVVTPWDGEVLAEEVETTFTLPDASEMAGFDALTVHFKMDCPDAELGEFGNCGAWDYLSHLYILDDDAVTWHELARFITTYHRAGDYVVDATPLLAHLKSGGTRTIRAVISPPWNPQAYASKLELSFSNRGTDRHPTQATPLWSGGDFNGTYNENQAPIDVAIPSGAKRVELWALITGHGGATSNCAEFCNHSHEFTIGDSTYLHDHPSVGSAQGCIGEIANGMVPNQGGTWWYGRGGWCPGQQVTPYVVDVTEDVTPGEVATLSYRGLLNGNTPPDDAGNIVMTSYLVIYE